MIARALGDRAVRLELEEERRVGGRIIRAGQVVTIVGHGHARVRTVVGEGADRRIVQVPGFRVLGFRGDEVHVFGAVTKTRAEGTRTFTVDRIGRRPRLKT